MVPRGWIYSIRYGHKLSFYGLENLVEKVNRIYYLLEFSETTTDYPAAFWQMEGFSFWKNVLRTGRHGKQGRMKVHIRSQNIGEIV